MLAGDTQVTRPCAPREATTRSACWSFSSPRPVPCAASQRLNWRNSVIRCLTDAGAKPNDTSHARKPSPYGASGPIGLWLCIRASSLGITDPKRGSLAKPPRLCRVSASTQPSEHRQRCRPAAPRHNHLLGIIVEGDIADPVEPVLDLPLAADQPTQSGRIGPGGVQAGDPVADFGARVASGKVGGVALDDQHLL